MTTEKNTNELILEKLLVIESEQKKQGVEIAVINTKIDGLGVDMKEGFQTMNEAIHYIGNKVFDNHEHRIKSLEQQLT